MLEETGEYNSRPFLADMSGFGCDCPGHPSGSHSSGQVFDMLYFTKHENSNFTQIYTHDAGFRLKYPHVPMWDGLIPNGMFHVERNKKFILEFLKCFPRSKFMIHEVVWNLLWPTVTGTDRNLFFQGVQYDTSDEWNHHTHTHIMFDCGSRDLDKPIIDMGYFK